MKLVTGSNIDIGQLSGIGRCSYFFPSNQHKGKTLVPITCDWSGPKTAFITHSLPNKLSAYIQAHCTLDANLATGVWLENTSPAGEFMGKIYNGVFQVIIDEAQQHMTGSWVGIGNNHGASKIYSGRWEIEYAGEDLKDLPEL